MSFVYTSLMEQLAKGDLSLAGQLYRLLIVDGYKADPDHVWRSQVTHVVASKAFPPKGYDLVSSLTRTAEGVSLAFKPVVLDKLNCPATGGVVYISHGGPSSQDELVAYIGFDHRLDLSGRVRFNFRTPLTITD